ncbi:hypothetical protein V6Z11_A02G049900 [Gossypium hirsutum]
MDNVNPPSSLTKLFNMHHKTRLHIGQLVKDTSAKLKQASETNHNAGISIGWPTSLPTSENEPFVKSVLREKKNALEELMLKSLPLRPRVEDLIDDACNKGIPVIILTAYGRSGEKTARYGRV